MGFIDDPSMVRVDLFKESGKWYTTISVKWLNYLASEEHDLQKILNDSITAYAGGECSRFEGMTAVCLEPYHEFSHPIMIKRM